MIVFVVVKPSTLPEDPASQLFVFRDTVGDIHPQTGQHDRN